MEDPTLVICEICKRGFKRIDNSHLPRVHRLTLEEYKNLYPDAKTISNLTCEKLSIASKSDHALHPRILSETTKQKISKSNKGRHPHTDEFKQRMSESKKGDNNPMKNLKSKEKMIKSKKGKTYEQIYGEQRAKERKQQMSEWMIVNAPMRGRKHKEESRKKMSESHKHLSEDKIRNWIKAVQRRPNKLECLLNDILQQHLPNEYNLNVDGKILILSGKIPDFVNVNGKKKVIELYGDYWHKDDNPNDRIALFKQYGWNCLIIWENELLMVNRNILISKLYNFQKPE